MLRAVNYMIGHHSIDTDRLGLYARSMGGRVAMTMANENSGGFDFKAVALVAPAGTDDAMVYYMGGDESWEEMKKTAREDGFIEHQGQKLTRNGLKSLKTITHAISDISLVTSLCLSSATLWTMW